jgi:hypothetical protein
MSSKSRRRQREAGERKQPTESKYDAMARGVRTVNNDSRPWRAPLRRIIKRKRTELRKAGMIR